MFDRLSTLCIPFTAASLLAISGLAAAQDAGAGAPEARSTTERVSVQTSTLNDGENIVEVRVVDGQVFVKLNGERRPTRSLDGDWTRFEVRSEDGEKTIATVLKDSKSRGVMVLSGSPTEEEIEEYRRTFEFPEDAARIVRRGGDIELDVEIADEYLALLRGLARLDLSEDLTADLLREVELSAAGDEFPFGTFRFEAASQPKSMIGITMNIEADEDGERVIVEEVMEGLPAAKAGLRSGDRIVEIESIGRADEQAVRRMTREFEPGQRVTLRILRDGEEIEKVIELAPYRSSVFGTMGRTEGGPGQRFFAFEQDAERLAEVTAMTERLQAEIAERLAEIERLAERVQGSANPEQIADELREAARALEESVRRMSEQRMRRDVERSMAERLRLDEGGGVIIGRDQRGERPLMLVPQAPPAPAAPSAPAPSEERIRTIESRLDALEESNRRIEAMLERLLERDSEG